jgi:acyl-CoA synthetase (AMP-forming)/AMP-acid ligase II
MTPVSLNLGDLITTGIASGGQVQHINTATGQKHSFSYQQIDHMAQGIAGALAQRGFGVQDRVAILSYNSVQFLATYLGILKSGATAVLISNRYADQQIQDILQDSGSQLLFADRPVTTGVPVIIFDQDFQHFSTDHSFVSYQPGPEDVAMIMYTSGSTGKPKGVLITHRARLSKFDRNYVSHVGKTLIASPMFHNTGLYLSESCMFYKNPMVIMDKFDARAFLQIINDSCIQVINGVPSLFLMLAKEQDRLTELDLSSVQKIILSGAPVGLSMHDFVVNMFPNATVNISYGSTEGGPGIFAGNATLPTPSGSVGYPRDGTDYRLVDGVLHLRGPQVMKGYSDQESNFTHDGFYVTNDIFTMDDQGFYYYVGRSDDMFKSGGNKIFPLEIEQVLDQHPAVLASAVVPVTDLIKGHKPYGFVVLKDNYTVTEQDLLQHLSMQLAHYQIPRKLWILDHMPIAANNKIDKNKLKHLAEEYLQVDHTESN